MPIPFIGKSSQKSILCSVVTLACLLVPAPFLCADPVPSLDQITVIDQDSQITLIWHFYDKLLPQKFTVPDSEVQIDLTNPGTLLQNLTLLSRNAFTVTIDGKPVLPAEQGQANPAPDAGCYATLFYPGHKNARVELRENLLPLYPASYIINYEIYSPLNRARGVAGYLTGGAPPPVVEYTQIGDDYQPSLFDALNAEPARLFKAELRVAWIYPSWLFLTLLVLVLRPARELYPLGWIMAMAWIVPVFLWAIDGAQVPLPVPAIVPGLATALLGTILVKWPLPLPALGGALALAGLLNGCHEVQRTTLERPPPTGANLTGLVLGLVVGFALVFAAALPILAECRKIPGFQKTWAPKLGLGLAGGALLLAFVN